MFQSTPPHWGRHRRLAALTWSPAVSIHAPAQGATTDDHQDSARHLVSIHAPAQGATRVGWHVAVERLFQSTPPHRGRRAALVGMV
ncbi:MAG: hypothetical protein WD894_07685, partial [Pirellulales bacterium]